MAQRLDSVRTAYKGWLKVVVATLTGDAGETITREILDHGRAAAVLPYDAERRMALLVRLPRAPAIYKAGEASVLEAIAGMLDGDEAPETCARREAMEEAGVDLGALEPVAEAWSSPGITTERIVLYLAPYTAAKRRGQGGGVEGEHEDIEVVEMALAELAGMLDRGEVRDMKTVALGWALRAKRPELFRGAPP